MITNHPRRQGQKGQNECERVETRHVGPKCESVACRRRDEEYGVLGNIPTQNRSIKLAEATAGTKVRMVIESCQSKSP